MPGHLVTPPMHAVAQLIPMNPGPLYPDMATVRQSVAFTTADRMQFLATIDGVDVWWDVMDTSSMPYFLALPDDYDWVGVDGPTLIAPYGCDAHGALDFCRNHYALLQ